MTTCVERFSVALSIVPIGRIIWSVMPATAKVDACPRPEPVSNKADTTGGDHSNGNSLLGLGEARAFFYAKARALLVSHWPVNSDAAPG